MRSQEPVPDSKPGWLVVLGVCITNLSLLPLGQCFGLLFEDHFQNLGISTAQTSLLLHLNSSICCLLGLTGGPLLRRLTFRQVALVGCALASTGVCLTSQADSVAGFVVTYCILLGVGQGILFPATSLALNSHFKRHRSLAMGLTIAATGLGPVVTPPVIAWAMGEYGVSGAVLLLGAVSTHSLAGALLLMPVPTQTSHHEAVMLVEEVQEASSGGAPKTESGADVVHKPFTKAVTTSEMREDWSTSDHTMANDPGKTLKTLFLDLYNALDLGLLRDPIFLNIMAGMGVSFVAELNFNMLTPFILAELAGLSRTSVAIAMSVQGVADISARLLVPLGADAWHWSSRRLYLISLMGSILGRSVLAHWHSDYHLILTLSVLLGTAKGIKAVFQALVLPNYVPLEKLPAATGLLMVTYGILSILLGPLIGYVRDASSSHVVALYVTSSLSLLCVLLWIMEELLVCRGRPAKTED